MIKRGASLIWAMVMSTALLFIAVTTATFVIKESQMSIRMDESSLAYAAAESGIDWGKYCVQSLPQCTGLAAGTSFGPSVFYVGGSKYVVVVKKEASQTKIESTGTSNGVNRKLEYVIKNINLLDRVPDTDLVAALQADGSYVQQFDYWASGSRFANIGLGNSSTAPTQGIYLKHTDVSGAPYIYLTTKNGAVIKESGMSLAGVDISAPYSLRIRIEYFKDLSAKMTVSKRNFATGMPEFSCIGTALVVDVRSLGLSPASFTKFYFNTALTTVTDSKYGDGSVQKLTSGTSEAYFDNMATTGVKKNTPFTLTYTAGANGSVSGTSPQYVLKGDSGTAVTAISSANYTFSNWSDGSTQNPRTDTNVTASISVIAYFKVIDKITVTKAGDGNGSVKSTSILPASSDLIDCGTDCTGTYTKDTQVILTATADGVSYFRGWSGGVCSGASATCTVTVSGVNSVTATFSRTYFSFDSGPLSDYYTYLQYGGGVDLLTGGTNWGAYSGKSLILNGVYAGPCGVGWQDPNDSYVIKAIYVPPTATTLSFVAAGGVGAGGAYHNDAILIQVLNSAWTVALGSWGANSNGENTLISAHTKAPPAYAGWNYYSVNVSAYRGQDILFYVRSHVGCWWSTVLVDELRVQ